VRILGCLVSGKVVINSDVVKKVYVLYGSLIKDYGFKNVSIDMSWFEVMVIFI